MLSLMVLFSGPIEGKEAERLKKKVQSLEQKLRDRNEMIRKELAELQLFWKREYEETLMPSQMTGTSVLHVFCMY